MEDFCFQYLIFAGKQKWDILMMGDILFMLAWIFRGVLKLTPIKKSKGEPLSLCTSVQVVDNLFPVSLHCPVSNLHAIQPGSKRVKHFE
jgi:hypothetical protein